MSMNTYPLHEHAAFLITDDIAQLINAKDQGVFDQLAILDATKLEELKSVGDASEVLEDVPDWRCCYEFEGTAVNIYDRDVLEKDDPASVEYYSEGELLVFIGASRDPELFTAAYANMKELADEFREKLKGFIPDDFPIEKHLYEIAGTYFS